MPSRLLFTIPSRGQRLSHVGDEGEGDFVPLSIDHVLKILIYQGDGPTYQQSRQSWTSLNPLASV